MRDVILGAGMYLVGITALLGSIVIYTQLIGPPTADRMRTANFIAGGGLLFFAVFAACACGLMIYAISSGK